MDLLKTALLAMLLSCVAGASFGGVVAMMVFFFCDFVLHLRGDDFFQVTMSLVKIVWMVAGALVAVIFGSSFLRESS